MDRVLQQVRHWRDELLNLSRRDRVLYYKPTRTASLVIQAPSAADVISTLERSKKGWGFFYPEEPEPPGVGDDADGVLDDDDYEPRVDPAGPVKLRKPDELLTQKADPKALESALRTLERRTNQEFMDKGIWVLYLVVGFLDWIDPDTKDTARTPVVLVPVKLARGGRQEPVRLVLAEEDRLINPALIVKMETDFDLHLPAVEDLEDLDIPTYLESVRKLVSSKGWSVSDSMAVDVFSFHKEVMYRDLKENEEAICESELIQALALGAESDIDLTYEPLSEDELDERVPLDRVATIRDADASQMRCIVASRDGHSFVMDGPPGTGKSQTIANILAQALLDGRTVLFVSEKMAALDVVKSRLDDVGLGEYLLELHSHKSTRKEVAETLHRALTWYPAPKGGNGQAELSRLTTRRKELSEYAVAMNEVRQPLGMSVHEAIGLISERTRFPQAPLATLDASSLDRETWDRIRSHAADLSRAWGPVDLAEDFLWREVAPMAGSLAGKKMSMDRVTDATTRLEDLQRVAASTASTLELWWDEAPRQAPLLQQVVEALSDRRQIPAGWLVTESLDEVASRIQTLTELSEKHSTSCTDLENRVGHTWRDIPPASATQMESAIAALQAELPWIVSDELECEHLGDATRFAATSATQLSEMLSRAEDLGQRLGLRTAGLSLDRLLVFSELASIAGTSNAPEREWLDEVPLERAKEALAVLGSLVEQYHSKAEVLKEHFKPSVLEADLHGLKVRFDTLHTGLRKLGGSYRADKRLLAEHTYTGKASKAAIGALGDAIQWQEALRALRGAEGSHAHRLGNHYYRSVETQFDDVTAALTAATRTVELARELMVDRTRLLDQVARGDDWDPEVRRLGEELAASAARWIETSRTFMTDPRETLSGMALQDVANLMSSATGQFDLAHQAAIAVETATERRLTIGNARMAARLRSLIHDVETEVATSASHDELTLGPEYQGLNSEWARLSSNLEWTRRLRELLGGPVDQVTAEAMLDADVDPASLERVTKAWDQARDALCELFSTTRSEAVREELESNYGEAHTFLDRLGGSVDDIDEWLAFVATCNALAELGLADAVSFAETEQIPSSGVVAVLERSALEGWVDWVLGEDIRLEKRRSEDRDALVDEFKKLDRKFIDNAAANVMKAVNDRRPQTTLGPAGIIMREGMKRRRHMPVRDLLKQTSGVTQQLKPCFMMSPLSVSQFLSPEMRFDMVVFDEASQVRPSDAINCIYRGSQLIVAGDQQQLPPTDFFQRVALDGDDTYQEDQVDEFESVLDLGKAGGMPSLPLRWHYRSQHESLITYSNYSFYDGNLITFPGAIETAPDVGIELFHVDGVYRRGGQRDNVVEAQKVAERVLFHANAHPHLSLGVVAFSEAQASTIEHFVHREWAKHADLESYFTDDRLHGFFVKNLENVQGDERDIMIFSIGYGPDENGVVTMNFGPLNRPKGERRLNVAITRARRRVEVVTSILPEQFTTTNSDGPRHLQRYLDFARRGIAALALEISDVQRDAESPFEEEVLRVIKSWGYIVTPQVGAATYRVDIGVSDPTQPGSYILGVECDGAMYHSSKVARDRDRLRQEVLEGLGWRIHRVWGTSWYQNRVKEEARLREAIERASGGGALGAIPKKPPSNSPPRVELVEADLDGIPSGAVPYKPHRPRLASWPDVDDRAGMSRLVDAIESVVEVEGPVAKEIVLQRVRESTGQARAGSRMRVAFDRALERATAGTVRQDRRLFLWPKGNSEVPVRYPTDDPRTQRRISEVCTEELEEAVLWIVEDAIEVSEEELSLVVSKLFGWERRGETIQTRLDDVIRGLIQTGDLLRQGENLRRSSE